MVDDGMCGEEHEILVSSSCSSRSSTTCSPELLPALFSAVSNLLFLLLRKMLFRQHVLCFVLSIPFCAVLIVRIVIPASLLLGLSRCCGWVMDVFNAVHPDVQLPASSLFSSHLLGSLLSPATPAVQTGSLQAATGSEREATARERILHRESGWLEEDAESSGSPWSSCFLLKEKPLNIRRAFNLFSFSFSQICQDLTLRRASPTSFILCLVRHRAQYFGSVRRVLVRTQDTLTLTTPKRLDQSKWNDRRRTAQSMSQCASSLPRSEHSMLYSQHHRQGLDLHLNDRQLCSDATNPSSKQKKKTNNNAVSVPARVWPLMRCKLQTVRSSIVCGSFSSKERANRSSTLYTNGFWK